MTLTPVVTPGPTESPIALTAFGIAVANDINELTTDMLPILSIWNVYPPVWSSTLVAPAIVNGSIIGKYTTLGKLGFISIVMNVGSLSTFGTGTYTWSIPPAWTAATNAGNIVIGSARLTHSSVSFLGTANVASGASVFTITTHGTTSNVGPTVPFTFASTDQVVVEARMEIA